MARLTSTLLALLMLLLVPALCQGGVLEHECDCSAAGELECQHEDACSEDPCDSLSSQPDWNRGWDYDHQSAFSSVAFLGGSSEPPDGLRASRPPRADYGNLPFAPSDRPLRI